MKQDLRAVKEYWYGASVFFFLIHIGVLTLFVLPFRWVFLWWLAGTYALRMFITCSAFLSVFGIVRELRPFRFPLLAGQGPT